MNKYRREEADATLDELVTSLLAAAAAPTEPGPLPGEGNALAAFRASQSATRRPSMLSSLTSVKAAVAALVSSGVLLTGGVGAATAGVLPDAAQDTASDLLAKVGVTVPGASDRSGSHADERGTAGDATAEDQSGGSKGKGGDVSDLAKSTDQTGVDKGAAVSGLASDGQSQAGQHGGKGSGADHAATRDSARQRSTTARSGAGSGDAAVTTPNTGGTGTADQATTDKAGDASSTGTTQADTSSAGHSSDGSGNRP